MKIRLLSLILFFSTFLSAQTGFRAGYVITQKGDTVRGQIYYKNVEEMCKVCTFKMKDSLINYVPSNIAGFRFIDGKYFVSKKLKDKTVFLEFLVKGKVNVYFSTDMYADHYYIEKDSLGLTEMPYKEEYKIKGDNEFLIKSQKHIGLLTYYMQDAPELKAEILAIKTPNEKDLIALAKNYHKAVCNDNNCIVYEKAPQGVKVNLEVSVGFQYFTGSSFQLIQTPPLTQVLAHVWLPDLSENCFFKAGLKCGWLKVLDANSNPITFAMIQIPLQVEYVFPSKIIQPKIGFGVDLYNAQSNILSLYPLTAAMAGVNIKLNKKYFLSVNYDVDFISDYFIVVKNIASHSLTIGINVTL